MQPAAPSFMGEVLEAWFEHTRQRRSPASDEKVRRILDRHLAPTLGTWKLSEVSVLRLEQLYARTAAYAFVDGAWRIRKWPLSSSTIRQLHFVVSGALRLARRFGWLAAAGLPSSPADDVELGPLPRRAFVIPPVAVALRLMAAAPPDLHLLMHLALATGARRGELAALTWEQINSDEKRICIDRALSETSAGVLMQQPKTQRSNRTITVDQGTIELLDRRRGVLAERYTRFVFADLARDESGETPVAPSTWSHQFRRLKTREGVSMRFHDLRHLAASLWLEAGIPIVDVSARLGHARTSTTTDIYGHLLSSRGDELAAEVMGRLLTELSLRVDTTVDGDLEMPESCSGRPPESTSQPQRGNGELVGPREFVEVV